MRVSRRAAHGLEDAPVAAVRDERRAVRDQHGVRWAYDLRQGAGLIRVEGIAARVAVIGILLRAGSGRPGRRRRDDPVVRVVLTRGIAGVDGAGAEAIGT